MSRSCLLLAFSSSDTIDNENVSSPTFETTYGIEGFIFVTTGESVGINVTFYTLYIFLWLTELRKTINVKMFDSHILYCILTHHVKSWPKECAA